MKCVLCKNSIATTVLRNLNKAIFKIPYKSLIQVPPNKDNRCIPIVLFLARLIIPEMLRKAIQDIFCFADINGIRSVILLANQKIDPNALNVLPVTRGNFCSGNLDCLTILIRQLGCNEAVCRSVHQKQFNRFSICHFDHSSTCSSCFFPYSANGSATILSVGGVIS